MWAPAALSTTLDRALKLLAAEAQIEFALALSAAVQSLYDLSWSDLPAEVTAKAGKRLYRYAFYPGFVFYFERKTHRKGKRPVSETLWVLPIERAKA